MVSYFVSLRMTHLSLELEGREADLFESHSEEAVVKGVVAGVGVHTLFY